MAKKVEKEDKIDKEFEDLQPNKKIIKNILITLSIIIVFGFVFVVSVKQDKKISQQKDNSKFHEINVDKYNELLYGEGKFVLLLGRPGCSHCVAFKPIITNVANSEGVDVYYLNTDTIETLEDWNEIWGLVEQEGTPTVAVIENKKLVLSNAGEMTKDELISFFKKAGVLSGE